MSYKLYKTIAVSVLLMFGITAFSTNALAQTDADEVADETEDTLLEEVIVTGSILRRSDDAPSPVTIMTDEWMQDAGINTVSEALQRLPANNAGTITNNWNVGFNFATGATAPALRGLTVQSTLSIVDGLRMAPYPLADDGQRNFVDLNTIPNATIERIEVLRDGASSTYGADAIAGVVNVITKKEVQGLHAGASIGLAQHGAGEEYRADVTWGFGDLEADGSNFYISAEYQKNKNVKSSDRSYPFNTLDWQGKCGPSGSCLPNGNWNGITAEDGSFNGFFDIPGVTLVRPVLTDEDTAGTGRYAYLNPAAGCREWPTVTITEDQSGTSPLVTCEVDYKKAYWWLQPDIERKGLTLKYTANILEDSQFYAMANYYLTNTSSDFSPRSFRDRPTPPRGSAQVYNVLIPAYVCSTGVGTFSGLNTGCDASNGSLNPYNPYAADGMRAQISLRNPLSRYQESKSRSYRVAVGLDGYFGNGYRYSTSFTSSEVQLTQIRENNLIPQRIMNVAATGSFDFFNPLDNSAETWEYIAPTNINIATSRLWQVSGNIAKDLMELQGGPLQAAIGASYRYEKIDAPSANPANDDAPYTRYNGINAVGTAGSRNVTSVFFEVDAPILESLDLVGSGRYDDYSSGQSNFSPKLGFKWTPLDSLALRGTWSQGFRIPSFNEAFGLPTTGYVTRGVDCAVYVDYCNAHGNNAYATTSYSLGLTQTGDPALDPEQSDSYTVGIIWQAMDNLNLTLDFWTIKVDDLISGVTDTSEAEDQYYANNGVVDIPGITVLPGNPDPAFPSALPQLGFIQSSYVNQDSQKVSGIDFAATYSMPIGFADWTSAFSVSYLSKYDLTTDGGDKLEYAGTLSPCNITSCSGAPKWRGSWGNTFQFGEKWTSTLTAYYTSGLDTASIDFGGVKGDCQFNADNFASTVPVVDGTPYDCKSSAQWNFDLTVQYQMNDRFQFFADVLNVFDIKPKFDPAAAYGLYGFNPAWAGPNIMGRFFRLGLRVDF